MIRKFTVVIEKDEDDIFVGSVPGLPVCHTQGKSLDELMERIREAVKLCLEVQEEDDCLSLELVGVLSVAV